MIATSEQISSMGKAVIRKVMHPSTKYPRASATLTSFIVPARPMNSVRLCSMVVRMDGASSLNPKKVASREKTMVTSWLWNTWPFFRSSCFRLGVAFSVFSEAMVSSPLFRQPAGHQAPIAENAHCIFSSITRM